MAKRDRRATFQRLAKRRLEKAIQQIRLIGNLSDTSNYRYSTEDAEDILRCLRIELRDLARRFKLHHPVPLDTTNNKSRHLNE